MSDRATISAPTEAMIIALAIRDGLLDQAAAEAALMHCGDAAVALRALIAEGRIDAAGIAGLRRVLEAEASRPPCIGPYRVVGAMGAGGMGMVYRVLDEEGGELAVKVLAPALADDVAIRARFASESRALLRVSSPHVVAIRGVGEDDGRPYLAMELMAGGSAADLADRSGGRLEARLAARICRDAARGLEALHAAGLIHRDIKPENILLDGSGVAKVADLGVARAATRGDDRLTLDGRTVGTPAFMAPEQARAEADLDIRADIYALGSTLYCLLVGRPAFSGSSPLMTLLQSMEKPLPDPGLVQPGLPASLRAVVMRAGAIDRNARYADPSALRETLDRFLAGDESAELSSSTSAGPVAKRLLLVDDDPLVLRVHRAALVARGFAIETAGSGAEALERAAAARFDGFLVDLMMDGMDGAELIRRLRTEGDHRRAPIVVLSNAYFDEELRAAREAGVDAILSKASYAPTQLADAVAKLLDELPAAGVASSIPVAAAVPLAPAFDACCRGLDRAARAELIADADLPALARTLREAIALAAGARPFHAALLAALEALALQLSAWPEHFNRSSRRTLAAGRTALESPADSVPAYPPAAAAVVVDDDPISRSVMRMSLRRVGFEVEAFAEAAAALAWLTGRSASLVLSDVVMAGMNGIEFAAAARRLPGARTSPIILVTSLSGFDAVFAGGGGADEVIAKPFLPLELGAKALIALAAPRRGPASREPTPREPTPREPAS